MHLLTMPQQATVRTGSRLVLARLHDPIAHVVLSQHGLLAASLRARKVIHRKCYRKVNAFLFCLLFIEKLENEAALLRGLQCHAVIPVRHPRRGPRTRAGTTAWTLACWALCQHATPAGAYGSWTSPPCQGARVNPLPERIKRGGAQRSHDPLAPELPLQLGSVPGAQSRITKVRRTQREKKITV